MVGLQVVATSVYERTTRPCCRLTTALLLQCCKSCLLQCRITTFDFVGNSLLLSEVLGDLLQFRFPLGLVGLRLTDIRMPRLSSCRILLGFAF